MRRWSGIGVDLIILGDSAEALGFPCPKPEPGCIFVGVVFTPSGSCFCAYACIDEPALVLIPCGAAASGAPVKLPEATT